MLGASSVFHSLEIIFLPFIFIHYYFSMLSFNFASLSWFKVSAHYETYLLTTPPPSPSSNSLIYNINLNGSFKTKTGQNIFWEHNRITRKMSA